MPELNSISATRVLQHVFFSIYLPLINYDYVFVSKKEWMNFEKYKKNYHWSKYSILDKN